DRVVHDRLGPPGPVAALSPGPLHPHDARTGPARRVGRGLIRRDLVVVHAGVVMDLAHGGPFRGARDRGATATGWWWKPRERLRWSAARRRADGVGSRAR